MHIIHGFVDLNSLTQLVLNMEPPKSLTLKAFLVMIGLRVRVRMR